VNTNLEGFFSRPTQPGSVSAFSIDPAGLLLATGGSPFAAGKFPLSVAVDPSGAFAYVANTVDDDISAFGIDANGNLAPLAGSPFPGGDAPRSVAIDPYDGFAYIVNTPVDE